MSEALTFGVIDYQAGNVRNVEKAFHAIGHQTIVINSPATIQSADALVLPGVGSFNSGMKSLNEQALSDEIREAVLVRKQPFLGICLGMQLMAREGEEGGRIEGLGLIPAHVERMEPSTTNLRLPHIGWDEVEAVPESSMFDAVPHRADFYFVHTYHVVVDNPAIVSGTCEYGASFNAAIESGHIWATQFHPEKSQRYGLTLLRNFVNSVQVQR